MLNKTENKIMSVLYDECKDKSSALITPADLLRRAGGGITLTEIDRITSDLASDGYFDLIYSDRHGEAVYCVTLLEKGKGYRRSVVQARRNIIFRIGLTVALAILSFIIGLILKAIFNG